MKKIRRIRIRTKTTKLVVIENQAGTSFEALKTCPTCGQQLLVEGTAVPATTCAESHQENEIQKLPDEKKERNL